LKGFLRLFNQIF